MKTSDFDYDLPEELIAHNPVSPRDHSRLFVYDTKSDQVFHHSFFEIAKFIDKNDLLVVNRSRVIPARITFDQNKEIFVLKNVSGARWRVMVRPGKFFEIGRMVTLSDDVSFLVKEVLDDGSRIIDVEGDLLSLGRTPLPPYIKCSLASADAYQTVYARESGSVAAPTAGLHFTDSLISEIEGLGAKFAEVVLHVGRGTFLPVTSEELAKHVMHEEQYMIDEDNSRILNAALAEGRRIVAVGTTSVRVLESAFNDGYHPGVSSTDIFIYPGVHNWKVVDALLTNFHLPKSTLLMLLAGFLERKGVENPVAKCRELYELAIRGKYRFYSFGDAMFII
ncbi:tRNA preQ1(34) S-adenosylmethionine ribosyltransferase-isomerase QueA [Candidatus Peregrinibacteria bacterium]|nr:tRNA preQ1(34) S-adenosylmethionine ribosyltransferase-isomerase QueA [Candidatus Peregrinibacteria bacterium]